MELLLSELVNMEQKQVNMQVNLEQKQVNMEQKQVNMVEVSPKKQAKSTLQRLANRR